MSFEKKKSETAFALTPRLSLFVQLTLFPNRSGFGDVFRPSQSLGGREIYTTATGGALAPAVFFLTLVQLCGFLL